MKTKRIVRISPTTQKPVELLEYFVELLSLEGDTVLDTFAGSGATGVACYNLNRNCTLIERDPAMFQKMKDRIDNLSTTENPLDSSLFEETV